MESWPFTFPQQHFTEDEWREFRAMVRLIRVEHPALYRRFLYEQTIGDAIVDWLIRTRRPTYGAMLAELEGLASDEQEWLVAVPLVNAVAPRPSAPLGAHGMLVQADDQRGGERWSSAADPSWDVQRHLGDRLTARGRWMRTNAVETEELDTRHMSTLYLVEKGTEEITASVAESRARLALAMWCILEPPYDRKGVVRSLWPAVGGWAPAPHLQFGLERKLYLPNAQPFGATHASVRGRVISEFAPYELPSTEQNLLAPFVAMERAAAGNHCATALLSAARSLYLAARIPNDLERTEKVIYIQLAKEALSYRGRMGQGKDEERWQVVYDRLGVRAELIGEGWELDELDEALTFAGQLRDLSTHRAEDILINLDFPHTLSVQLKQLHLPSDDLALARVSADWPLFLTAVRRVVRKLTVEAVKRDWDDQWFHSQFERNRRTGPRDQLAARDGVSSTRSTS